MPSKPLKPFDITLIGAGPAGMIAMLRLAQAGFSVLGLERSADQKLQDDLRSTAFLMPSVDTLEKAGVWQKLITAATPLETMEIIDATPAPMKRLPFRAQEIDQAQFGFNIQNIALKTALRNAVHNHPRIEMRYQAEIASFQQFDEMVEIRLKGAAQAIQTRLIVAADGRNSQMRALLGIEARQKRFGQNALAFTVTHDLPHNFVSSEVHATGGPFTTVPVQDVDGKHASAIVWMDDESEMQARKALPREEFEAALNQRSFGIRGSMRLLSEIGMFPIMSLEAERLNDHRVVLIGEAAHVVPPIGAQGLNMSLRDSESLARALETGALQTPKQLDHWARARRADIAIRRRGIDWLNQISIADAKQSHKLRNFGLSVFEKTPIVRKSLMKLGLGQ